MSIKIVITVTENSTRIQPMRKTKPLLRAPNFRNYTEEGITMAYVPGLKEMPGVKQIEQSLRNVNGMSKVAIERSVRGLPDPRAYLKTHRSKYAWADVVLRYGRPFLTKDMGSDWEVPLRPWHCYENAATIAHESHGRKAYTEGLCVSPFAIELHAWNVENGTVIDQTWPCSHLNRYFGITFGLAWLKNELQSPNGCVFGRWDPVTQYLEKRAPR